MQAMIVCDLEHVVLALEDVDKKIMDVEDGYTLQYNVKTSNGYANIQLNEDELLEGKMLFNIHHVVCHDDEAKDELQTTVKIYRDDCAILNCEITGDNDLANLILREILHRYYSTLKKNKLK